MRKISIALSFALCGCATNDGALGAFSVPDAAVTCAVAGDVSFTVTQFWPLRLAQKVRPEDTRVICAPKTTPPAATNAVTAPAPVTVPPFTVNKLGVPQ